MEAAERRSLRCVWVTGGRALTEQEAAVEIVSEARLLLQEDLAQLGVQWDPATLPSGPPVVNIPDDLHSNDSDTSSASYLSSHGAQGNDIKDHQEGEGIKRGQSKDTDRCGIDSKEEFKIEKRMELEKAEGESKTEQGKSMPEGDEVNRKLEEHRKEDRAEPQMRQTDNEIQTKSSKITKNNGTSKKMLLQNDTEDTDERTEKQKHKISKQELDKSKGIVSIRPESHQANLSVPEKSLTQEPAEIVSSPLPLPMPHPPPSSSPVPPPRFRAPISRVEKQDSVPSMASHGDGITGLITSPVQPGKMRHSRALSKVLHSIQTDRSLQDNVETAKTSHSKPTGVSAAQNSAPAGQVPSTVQALGPGQETLRNVPAPANADIQDPAPSDFPASVPLFSPKAKRRRIDGGKVDTFSSPELYAGDERDEEVRGDVKKGEDSFGDSFELDTQTERIILQQITQRQHRDENDRGLSQSVERKTEMVEAAIELHEEANKGSNRIEAPDNAHSRFNISLTDSQMELILNTSNEVSDQLLLCTDYKHKRIQIICLLEI